jgi:NADPH-dependent curcumin reductase CurA
VGIDAAVRTWLDDQPGYLPPVQLGEVVRAATVGEVVATNCEAYQVGDVVTTLGGFSDYSIARDDLYTTVMGRMSEGTAGIDRAGLLALFGSTGATAYFGMHDIGKPQAGETVLVSAAAGATGSIAGQLAKAAGARVVGLAGSDEKCTAVVDDFGFDACINYRSADLRAALKEQCPDRIDVYFDNVGGPILDAALGRLAMNARVVLCGDLQLRLRRAPRPGQLRETAGDAGPDGGVQHSRPLGPLRRGQRRAATALRRGGAEVPQPRVRGLGPGGAGAERPVRGHQHRQNVAATLNLLATGR